MPADPAVLDPSDLPLGAPRFDQIAPDQFLPAFRWATEAHAHEIETIASDAAPADFANTIAALERAGEPLSRVRRIFWALSSAQSGDAIRAIEPEVSTLLSRHATTIDHDPRLFARVDAVWRGRGRLGEEELRLVDNVRRGFVAGGATLDGPAKARFAAIDERLTMLSVRFGQNVLAVTAAWSLVLAEDDLDGLPQGVRDVAARRASEPGRYRFTLDRGDVEDFLAYSTRRDLREQVWRAFTSRCDGGPHDNRPLIAETLALRHELARLLGYPTYAAYKLEDSMAKTPEAAMALMMRVWAPARAKALEEAAELQAMIDADGGGFRLEAWDWRFYAERIRRERYALDGVAVKRHLTLGKIVHAAFAAACRLYGLRFTARPELPVYHPDVRAWAIDAADGGPVGLLYTDYIARPEKHGGAWMGSLRVQETLDGEVRPIVYCVANYAAAATPADTQLSLDEARTLFHEFGHALHALLSHVTYPSLAGTAVARDFVEFPSKFMEHWIVAPQVLRGFGVPEELIAAIGRADTYGAGFSTVELTAASIVDLAIHMGDDATPDAFAIQAATLARIGLPEQIGMRHRLPHFTHVFDGGYAAAYYSYLWSEVLDADAFAAFEEAGDMFDAGLAARFRDEVLARGDSRDPMASFTAFRGREPDEGALLRSRGLV